MKLSQVLLLSLVALPNRISSTKLSGRLRKEYSGRSDDFKGYNQVLHNNQNVQYFADFYIGGQEIAGIFDTGSFDILVRSMRCKECYHPTKPYDPFKSTTYRKNGTLSQHSFGSGDCVTLMGYDTVGVGPELEAKDQAIYEIVSHQISVMDNSNFAAIVGIGPGYSFDSKQKTLLMSYDIDDFSICLNKETGSSGWLHWGPREHVLSQSETATARVFGRHHWATRMHNVTFMTKDGKRYQKGENESSATLDTNSWGGWWSSGYGDDVSMPCMGEHGCAAIIDSGTSLIAAPSEALTLLGDQLGEIQEDCSNLHELPTLRFILDGHEFDLPPQAYVMKIDGLSVEADNVWDLLFFRPKLRKKKQCIGAFMTIDMESQLGPVWILGMPFFRYYHTTFRRESQTMRFARAGQDCSPEPFKVDSDKKSLLAISADRQDAAYMPLEVDPNLLMGPSIASRTKDKVVEI